LELRKLNISIDRTTDTQSSFPRASNNNFLPILTSNLTTGHGYRRERTLLQRAIAVSATAIR
jgi:hypothetical protein